MVRTGRCCHGECANDDADDKLLYQGCINSCIEHWNSAAAVVFWLHVGRDCGGTVSSVGQSSPTQQTVDDGATSGASEKGSYVRCRILLNSDAFSCLLSRSTTTIMRFSSLALLPAFLAASSALANPVVVSDEQFALTADGPISVANKWSWEDCGV
jgi:hypothetical protein